MVLYKYKRIRSEADFIPELDQASCGNPGTYVCIKPDYITTVIK